MAYPDAYFILPQFRKGGAGAKLLAEMERTLWEKGVVKIYLSTKVHDDHGSLFEQMGYKLTYYERSAGPFHLRDRPPSDVLSFGINNISGCYSNPATRERNLLLFLLMTNDYFR